MVQGHLINVYKPLICWSKDRARLLSVVPHGRTRSNEDELKYSKFHLNITRKNVTVRVVMQ